VLTRQLRGIRAPNWRTISHRAWAQAVAIPRWASRRPRPGRLRASGIWANPKIRPTEQSLAGWHSRRRVRLDSANTLKHSEEPFTRGRVGAEGGSVAFIEAPCAFRPGRCSEARRYCGRGDRFELPSGRRRAKQIEDPCEPAPAFRGRAALFGADDFAADGTQSRLIDRRSGSRRRSDVERLA
jgi:hypothetical protein